MLPKVAKFCSLLTASIFLGTSFASAQVPIRGRVTDEKGAGLAGARIDFVRVLGAYEYGVHHLRGENPEPESVTRSDKKGFFKSDGDTGGLYLLRVSAADRLLTQHWIGPLVEPVELPTLTLRRANELKIRVIDQQGNSVVGARVIVQTAGDTETFADLPWWPTVRFAITDEKGATVLTHRTGEHLELVAFAPGFVVEKTLQQAAPGVTLTLVAGMPRIVEVRNADGQVAEGVLVQVGASRTSVGITGRDGRLLVHAPRRGSLPLNAEAATGFYAEGEIPMAHHGEVLAESEAVESEPTIITLRAPETLSGRVVNAVSQRPLAGVWLSFHGQVTRSADDGSYSLPVRSYHGEGTLSAAASGYLRLEERLMTGGTARQRDLALRPALGAEGMVIDQERMPIADAEIRAMPGGLLRSDLQGRFWFLAEPNVVHQLRVSKSGFLTAKVEVSFEPRAQTPFEVVLERGRKAVGYVVDLDGQPIVGARVRRWDLREKSRTPASDTRTQDDGRFELSNLGVGGFDLFVQASGFAQALLPGLGILEDGSEDADIDLGTIRLEAGVSLAGRVVDQDGRPIESAIVKTIDVMSRGRGRRLWRKATNNEVTSDEEGRFVIGDRTAGEQLTLHAQHELYKQTTLAVEMPADKTSGGEDVRLVLARQATLRGQVIDQQGRAVAKARVKVFSLNGSGDGGYGHSREINEDGRFEEHGDPGRLRLSAEKGDLRSPEFWLEVAPGEVVEGIRLVVEPLGAIVEGVVVGADDRPVAGARILVTGKALRPQVTDGEGRFRLTGLDPGSFAFIVWPAGHGSRHQRELDLHRGVNTVEVRLPLVHQVRGRVVDQEGLGLGGVQVVVTGAEGNARATSQADGTFVIDDVPTGDYQLRGRKEGHADLEPERPVEVDGTSVFGIEVRLVPAGVITGRLSGLGEGSAVHVRVEARRDGEIVPNRPSEGIVGAEGSFRIDGLAPGTWIVQVLDLATGRQASGRVVVESGGQAWLDLELVAVNSP